MLKREKEGSTGNPFQSPHMQLLVGHWGVESLYVQRYFGNLKKGYILISYILYYFVCMFGEVAHRAYRSHVFLLRDSSWKDGSPQVIRGSTTG